MEEIYPIGVMATVVQNLKLPNQNVKVMVEGLTRAEIVSTHEGAGYTTVVVREIDTKITRTKIGRHTSELQSQSNLVCRLLLEKKKKTNRSLNTAPTNE